MSKFGFIFNSYYLSDTIVNFLYETLCSKLSHYRRIPLHPVGFSHGEPRTSSVLFSPLYCGRSRSWVDHLPWPVLTPILTPMDVTSIDCIFKALFNKPLCFRSHLERSCEKSRYGCCAFDSCKVFDLTTYTLDIGCRLLKLSFRKHLVGVEKRPNWFLSRYIHG